jgi:hypothetical protein
VQRGFELADWNTTVITVTPAGIQALRDLELKTTWMLVEMQRRRASMTKLRSA